MSNVKEIKSFVSKRPIVKAAYGYGSGIFKQSGYTKKDKPQIDLILVVDDLKKWHLENMKLNPKDYSFIGKLFFKYGKVSKLKGTTGITYLSNISYKNLIFKYGTIEEQDLLKYLNTWESFYMPGRFQKTIYPLIETDSLISAIEKNRTDAMYTALLTLPKDKNKLIDIYTQLCGLSYLGDTRMRFAENPRKVLNIVEGSYDKFEEMYGIKNNYFKLNNKKELIIDHTKLLEDINKLPKSLLDYVSTDLKTKDINIIREKILEYFTNLNKEESTSQTKKGIYTNGVIRSIKYASQKVLKKINYKKK